MESAQTLADLWRGAGCDAAALQNVTFTGTEPVLPSTFRVGEAAQASIAASALAAAEVRHLRGQRRQKVAVDMRHAAAEFRSERYFRVDGKAPGEMWDPIARTYPCGDGRWVRLHTNFDHHRDRVLQTLGCANDRESVTAALGKWKAGDFEDAIAAAGGCVTMMRSIAEWDAHPQGQAVARLPVVEITRLADGPPQPLPPLAKAADRPLTGIRVLDLTRIVAGPVCGRTLAAYGADVMLVSGPHLPFVRPLVVDTGRGKRATFIDLREASGQQTLRRLLAEADVLVQGYRPGAIAGHGFDPQEAAKVRPGLVYVSLSAYGREGAWTARRGFDSLVQTVSGMNHAEGEAAGSDAPRPLPCQALDHASGYLLAFGALVGLMRRATQGGSWHVQVSLARTGRWIRDLGRVDGGLGTPDTDFDQVQDLLETSDSGFGKLVAMRHAAQLADTPAGWTRPSVPLGTHPPQW